MKIKEIKVKSIVVKSELPDSDFVINPYIGCMHGCIYCYACFMKRFTNHSEQWGEFVDVKINAGDLIPSNVEKYKNKSITISSVTDPYQPIEKKYKLTRNILKKLISAQPNLCIMTKSDLIVRDIHLLKKFKKCRAGVSLSILDDNIRKQIELFASTPLKRINAIKKLNKAGIKTFLFISPMFPELTDWKKIITKTKNYVNEYWFENLNIRSTNWVNIEKWLKKYHLKLLNKYKEIYFMSDKDIYWNKVEKRIKEYCLKNKIKHKIYFHHKNKKH